MAIVKQIDVNSTNSVTRRLVSMTKIAMAAIKMSPTISIAVTGKNPETVTKEAGLAGPRSAIVATESLITLTKVQEVLDTNTIHARRDVAGMASTNHLIEATEGTCDVKPIRKIAMMELPDTAISVEISMP